MARTVLRITEEVIGFERVFWHVDAANLPSIKVAQKLGFLRFGGYDTGVVTRTA
jgi:RimJ/RimL family protein N-acetyltransferase